MADVRWLNEKPADTLEIVCDCRSKAACQRCYGSGRRLVRACKRCGGTGSDNKVRGMAPACLDCRGDGYREMDNEHTPTTDERSL